MILFAFEVMLYRQIYNHDDSITLQQDLDNLAAWEKMWGMQFHDQTLAQYSRFYLTMDLYAKVLASVF
jgi:hypothetical protein